MLVVLRCHVKRSRDILVQEVSSMGKVLLWPLPHATIRQRSRRSLMYSRLVASSPISRRFRLLPDVMSSVVETSWFWKYPQCVKSSSHRSHATSCQRSRRSLVYSRPVASSPISRRFRSLPDVMPSVVETSWFWKHPQWVKISYF